jgi:hypothetical protein
MKLRLRRVSNLFREEVRKNLLALFCLLFVLPVLLVLLTAGFHPIYLSLIVVLNLIGFFTIYFGFAGKAEIYEGVITYSEYYEASKGDRKRVTFTVTDIHDVEFLQNAFEKRHDIGRIRFRGNAEVSPPFKNTEQRVTHFGLCGIPNFEDFKEKISTMYPPKG